MAALIPTIIFVGSLLPEFSRAAAQNTRNAMAPLYTAALDPHFALTLGIAGAIVALAPWILAAWLGTPPQGAVACLVALAVAQAGYAFTGVASTVVRARGDLRLEFAYAVLATGLHVTLSILGLRVAGLPGLLVGAAGSSVIAGIWYVQRVDASLELAASGRVWPHALPFLAAACAAGGAAFAAATALHAVRVGPGAYWGLLGGGAAYALGFTAVLRFAFRPTWSTLLERARRLRPTRA
jgi:O-antigen/teichoic acid export membrane protein